MIKETKYFKIEYTNNDISYIDKLCDDIDNKALEIMKYFNIDKIDEKFNIKLIATKKEFSKIIRELIHFEDDEYGIGFVKDKVMYCLSYLDYKSTYYKNDNYDDFIKTIIHEFVHTCHMTAVKGMSIKCINEGLACYLSHQDENEELKLDCSIEDILENKLIDYKNYYVIMKYIIDNYDKEYVDKMIYDKEFAKEEIINTLDNMISKSK